MRIRRFLALAPLVSLVFGACSAPPPKFCPIKPGDVVVTEVFVNPDGDNAGRQWFELYNATSSPIDLSQVQITYSKPDGIGNKKTHVMSAYTIKPRQYMVLGNVGPVARPAHMDYGYGNDLGTMLTTDGKLTVSRDDCMIDQATFPGYPKASAFLPGPQAPDAIANDTVDKWCKSQVVFVDGFGTPQMANETCGGGGDGGVNPTTCKDKGTVRPIVPPARGDLVISEIMANPKLIPGVATEAKLEWLELEVSAKAKGPIDLIGLRIGSSMDPAKLVIPADLGKGDCWPVMPGDHVLFVDNKDKAMNDGLPDTGAVFIASFTLANGGGTAAIGNDTTILDSVTYPDQAKLPQADGLSYSLDPDHVDVDDPLRAMRWCPGQQTYGPSLLNKGSPGAKNPSCGFVDAGKCVDKSGGMPTTRDIVSPKVGDLIVNEVMAKPSAGGNPAGEWLELKAMSAIDLNGVQMGVDPTKLETIGGADCHRIEAGKTVVLAKAAGMNNGLPLLESWQVFKFGLTDAGGTLYLVAPASNGSGGNADAGVPDGGFPDGGEPDMSMSINYLDQAVWKTKNTGDAYSRDANGKWCFITDAMYSYNGGMDRGTPGADNPVCP